jgi:monoamine oxidase
VGKTSKIGIDANKEQTGSQSRTTKPTVDVAIVGAGPAGLYAAWRILSDPAYQKKTIALFDAADRVGGRILSVTLPQVPYVTELGAMRYLPEQILTRSLIENQLQLEHSDFIFDTAGYVLRGKRISQEDLNKAKSAVPQQNIFPYAVENFEIAKSPIELIVLSIQRALRVLEMPKVERAKEARGVLVTTLRRKLKKLDENTAMQNLVRHFTEAEWRLIKRYGHIDGRPLYTIGFWDLLQQFLSPEGYNLAHDGSGYQSIMSMWNAADAIVWFLSDFAGSPYRTISAGMNQLIERLCAEILNKTGERARARFANEIKVFNLGWELRNLRQRVTGEHRSIELTFGIGEFVGRTTTVPERTIVADTVILALPQPALKSLKFHGFQIEPSDSNEQTAFRLNETLNAVTANPLFKAFVFYEKPWWRDETSPSCFRVFTDLPLRQVYHFGSDRQSQSVSTSGDRRSSCMVLLYSDARFAEYWKRLDAMSERDQRYFSAEFESLLDKEARAKFEQILKANGTGEAVLARIQDQLAKVTGETVPEPITLILKHWSDKPYHAGWHAWNMGAQSWVVAEALVRPFLDANLFTCGEAFSGEQGWIEGALKSAERVLERLGLSQPAWVDKTEYARQKELWN